MTRYVLDTDTLTLYQMGYPAVVARVAAHPIEELAVTVISVEEQLSGWYTRLRRTKKRDELAKVYQRLTDAASSLARFRILSYTEPAMDRYDALRKSLRTIGKNDLRIAAIVRERDDTLVSRNLQDFRRVPGLKVEDWSV